MATLPAALEELRALLPDVLAPTIAARRVADALGTVTDEQSSGVQVVPRSARWSAAWVGKALDRDDLAYLELTPAADTTIALRDVTAWLGKGRVVPLLHPGEPERQAFTLDRPEYGRVAMVFASVDGRPRPEARVVRLMVRADPR